MIVKIITWEKNIMSTACKTKITEARMQRKEEARQILVKINNAIK